jgi:hypothetical protein
MLDGTVSKEELARLLSTPLSPDLDYFDATASIEAMAEHIRGLHKLIGVMFESLTLQGQSVISQYKSIVEIKGDLAAAGVPRGEEEPLIIMPPKLDIN